MLCCRATPLGNKFSQTKLLMGQKIHATLPVNILYLELLICLAILPMHQKPANLSIALLASYTYNV